ncbi:MAG TPA: hypothetical protein VLB68_31725, partial [Pyrinomonadaceae bacterium]|nr:hypothetical protein [Pyrinomonadaceae bacterium]
EADGVTKRRQAGALQTNLVRQLRKRIAELFVQVRLCSGVLACNLVSNFYFTATLPAAITITGLGRWY